MKAGACEFLEKPFEDQDLLDAVNKALTREHVARKQRIEHRNVMHCFATLSPREREVYALVVQGLINRDIADLEHALVQMDALGAGDGEEGVRP